MTDTVISYRPTEQKELDFVIPPEHREWAPAEDLPIFIKAIVGKLCSNDRRQTLHPVEAFAARLRHEGQQSCIVESQALSLDLA